MPQKQNLSGRCGIYTTNEAFLFKVGLSIIFIDMMVGKKKRIID